MEKSIGYNLKKILDGLKSILSKMISNANVFSLQGKIFLMPLISVH